MGVFGRYRMGKYLLQALGDDFANEGPISAEQFYVIPLNSRGKRGPVSTVGLSGNGLRLSIMDASARRPVERIRVPLDTISWLDVDANGPDFPWVLDSTSMGYPVVLSAVGHGARLPDLLIAEVLNLQQVVVTVQTSRQRATVEYLPWRLGTPGGWAVTGAGDTPTNELDAIVGGIQSVYRSGMGFMRGPVLLDFECRPVPRVLGDAMTAHALTRLLGMKTVPTSAIVCADHLLAISDTELAVSEMYDGSGIARGPLAAVKVPLADVKVRLGLYADDIATMYIEAKGFPRTFQVECDELDENWRPLIARASGASTAAPSDEPRPESVA